MDWDDEIRIPLRLEGINLFSCFKFITCLMPPSFLGTRNRLEKKPCAASVCDCSLLEHLLDLLNKTLLGDGGNTHSWSGFLGGYSHKIYAVSLDCALIPTGPELPVPNLGGNVLTFQPLGEHSGSLCSLIALTPFEPTFFYCTVKTNFYFQH